MATFHDGPPAESTTRPATPQTVRRHRMLRPRLQVLIEEWRQHYNTVRPHGALGYRLPVPAARAIPAHSPMPLPALALGAGLY